MQSQDEVKVEQGGGNVSAGLGYPDADAHRFKADLVLRIDEIIRRRNLTQAQTGELPGLSQPDVSRLMRGEYSMERLLRLLTVLGCDVDIVIRGPRSRSRWPRTE